LYTLPRRVGDVEGRVVLSDGWDKPRCARRQAVYSQNRDGYEVLGCGRGGGGSEVRRESPPYVLQHGAGSGQHADKQIQRFSAPIIGFGTAPPL